MIRFSVFLVTALCFISSLTIAQTQQQSTGWLLLLNNTKISEKWGIYADIQVRSSDKWDNVRNVLFRPGVTYYMNAKNEFTVGYLLNQTFLHLDGSANNQLTEHRVWEQYVLKHKLSTANIAHRFRLEQRFIERAGKDDLFSQRLRYFIRAIIPLEKGIQKFEHGIFVALQNELFFNIQNKAQLNGKIFDQNRAYVAGGYRVSKSLDLEIGYLNQAIKGVSNNTVNNVVQLAVYTKF